MPKPTTDIKTPADFLAFLRELGTTHITALNGLLDKVPEAVKTELSTMRERFNGLLKGLPPLDQVPSALEASTALNSFSRTIQDIFEYLDYSRERIASIGKTLEEKTTALNGLNDQVTKGELLDKAKVQIAVDTAVTNAIAPFKTEIATLRKDAVALCGLPEAPDSILNSATADFMASLTAAKKNLAACTAAGMALGKKGDAFMKKSIWLAETAFNGEMTTIKEMVGNLTGGTGGDPFKGNPAPANQQTETTAGKKLSIA